MKTIKEFITFLTEAGVYMKKLDQKKLDIEQAKYTKMSSMEKRKEYKAVGSLGKKSLPWHIMLHRVDGSKKHDWGFDAQYPGYSQEKCSICGRTQYRYSNGAIRQR